MWVVPDGSRRAGRKHAMLCAPGFAREGGGFNGYQSLKCCLEGKQTSRSIAAVQRNLSYSDLCLGSDSQAASGLCTPHNWVGKPKLNLLKRRQADVGFRFTSDEGTSDDAALSGVQ